MNFLRRFLVAMSRQISIILAIAEMRMTASQQEAGWLLGEPD